MYGSYWPDHIRWIIFAGSYRLDCIGMVFGFAMINFLLFSGWFVTGCMVRIDWMGRWRDRGGMEVPTLAGTVTGAPPLSLEGRQVVRSGGWHQLFRCFKGAEYLCCSRKIVQIDCTQIGTNT